MERLGVWIGRLVGDRMRLSVWQPSGSKPRPVDSERHGDVFPLRGSDLLIAPEDEPCVQVLRLDSSGAFDTVLQHCDVLPFGGTLSPDGRMLVLSDGTAYTVPENTRTNYSVPKGYLAGDDLRPQV